MDEREDHHIAIDDWQSFWQADEALASALAATAPEGGEVE